MPVSDTLRQATWDNGRLSARLGQPVTVCPFAAQSTPQERTLARIWVTGYLAAAPPPPGEVDLDSPGAVEAFNPGWKDQPRRKDRGLPSHGGRWVDQAGGATPDVEVRKPSTRKPSTPPQARGSLASSVASGVTVERSLIDGPLGQVDLVTFRDGTQGVRKAVDEGEGDKEQLAALVAQAIGLRAPRVHRDGDTVYMDYMEGEAAAEAVGHWRDVPSEWADSDDGRLLGLFDLLIDNQDRHNANWLVNDGRIEAIDHNFAYQGEEAGDEAPQPRSDFENHFIDEANRRQPGWADNDLSPQDVAAIRARLVPLRSQYAAIGRQDWHAWTLARLDAIGAHAKGRRSRLP